jgi:hypothetical protein
MMNTFVEQEQEIDKLLEWGILMNLTRLDYLFERWRTGNYFDRGLDIALDNDYL